MKASIRNRRDELVEQATRRVRTASGEVIWRPYSIVLMLGLYLVTCHSVIAQVKDRATANETSAAEVYQSRLQQWRSLLKNLRTLQIDFVAATAAEQEDLRRRWKAMVQRGPILVRQLREAGVAAYREAPGQDRDLERLLVKILDDHMEDDRYEEAAELAQALLDNGCEIKTVYDSAGVAAFAINDYNMAEKHLKQAGQLGVLDRGKECAGLLEKYKAFWKTETDLREKEAKADDLPRVQITTTKGEIVLELFENEALDTVGNFISLVEREFYDDLAFHRVLPGFMAQAGCPLGTGQGGPGYTIYCECLHRPDHRKHFRGSLSMAKQSAPHTGGSQFFITFVPTDHLNGQHTVFGRVVEGLEVLAELHRVDPGLVDQPQSDRIVKAEVIRKRDHEYVPNRVN